MQQKSFNMVIPSNRIISLLGPILGHVGDGNFHMFIALDPESADEIKKVEELSYNLGRYCTTTEHFTGFVS